MLEALSDTPSVMKRSKLFWSIGVLLILGAVGVWGYAVIEQAMVGGEVRAAIRSSGQPTRFWKPQWSDWKQGSAGLSAGPLVPKRFQSATISAHRVGRAEVSLFNSINYYEARYVFPDGRSEVWAAHGPRPQVENNALELYGLMGLMIFLGVSCMFLAKQTGPLTQAAADGQQARRVSGG